MGDLASTLSSAFGTRGVSSSRAVASARAAAERARPRDLCARAMGPVALAALAACALSPAPPARAQSLWDDPAFALYRQAGEAMEKKNYASAADLARRAIAEYPDHLLAYYLAGQAAAAESRWDEAAAAFARAAELYPKSFAVARDLGASYERLDKIPEAARAYERALSIRDQDDIRVRLALMLAENGEEPRALEQLDILTARDSKVPEVWATRARLVYETGDWPASEKAYTKALALRDDPRNWFNLGVVRVRLKNLSGALEAFEKAGRSADLKKQADAEAARVREAMGKGTGSSRTLTVPGQYTSPAQR